MFEAETASRCARAAQCLRTVDDGSKDIFVHISAVERAGLSSLNENLKLSYELERGQQGKTSAVNLQTE
jgi:cold shock CspA family protein